MFSKIKNRALLAYAAVVCWLLSVNSAFADLLEYDEVTNTVTFNPGELIAPLMVVIVAAVTAAIVFYVTVKGIKWLKRMFATFGA